VFILSKIPEEEPVFKSDGKELRDELNRVVMDNHFLALRYDLTAPLARYYTEKIWFDGSKGNLTTKNAPLYRRFQYGPVYRYETKLDPGRFREFWQLDFDSVGAGDVASDAEVCMVLSDAMEAVGLNRGSFIVRVNNRKVLKGFLQNIGIVDEESEQNVLRIIDKIDKIGIDGMKEELGKGRTDISGAFNKGLGIDENTIKKIVDFFIEFGSEDSRKSVLHNLKNKIGDNQLSIDGIEELTIINNILSELSFNEDRVIFDPTLVRGMAYYTGPIFEVESKQTYIDSKGRERKVGSICGGGRYDALVENLLGIKVPATGASIGVDRLAELLVLTKQVPETVTGPVFIVVFDQSLMSEYQKLAQELRDQDIDTEIYYGNQRGLKKQLAYADKKNSPFAILIGEDEITKEVVTVKNLQLGKLQTEIQDRQEWKSKVQVEVQRQQLTQYIIDNL